MKNFTLGFPEGLSHLCNLYLIINNRLSLSHTQKIQKLSCSDLKKVLYVSVTICLICYNTIVD